MKKIILFIICIILNISLYSKNIEIKPGWNLIGTGPLKIDLKASFGNDFALSHIWLYNNETKEWNSFGLSKYKTINYDLGNYSQLNNLDSFKGFWLYSLNSISKEYTLIEIE